MVHHSQLPLITFNYFFLSYSALVLLNNYLLIYLFVSFFPFEGDGILIYLHIAHWDGIIIPISRYVAFSYSPWIINHRDGAEEFILIIDPGGEGD